MSKQVDVGNITGSLALELVMGMALIMSGLTAAVWLYFIGRPIRTTSLWRRIAVMFLWTSLVLIAYTLLVLTRRNFWTQSQGLSVYDQFLPVVGRINAEFLSEFDWIAYLFEVIPAMSLLSAVLFSIRIPKKSSQ
jgi:hypothetical protein